MKTIIISIIGDKLIRCFIILFGDEVENMEYVPIGLIIILFTIFNMNINTLQRNQERIESKLDRIIEHLGLPEPYIESINDELKDELIKLVEANKKVKAIKKLRDVTGMGLKEAKDYVDKLIINR